MAKLWRATLLAFTLAIIACGSSGMGTTNINGNWTATLTNANGSPAYQFSVTLAQGSDNSLTITDLAFRAPGACDFVTPPTAQGSFTATSRAFAMSMVAGGDVGAPVLDLQGALSNSTISGTWSASGVIPPCSGSGNFTIQPAMAFAVGG